MTMRGERRRGANKHEGGAQRWWRSRDTEGDGSGRANAIYTPRWLLIVRAMSNINTKQTDMNIR
jgi:hypothetical protein